MTTNAGRPVRILQFIASTRAAGTEVYLHELVKNMDPARWKHDFLVLSDDHGPMPQRYRSLGCGVKHLYLSERMEKRGKAALPGILRDVKNELRNGDYDLAIAYGLRANLLCRFAGAGLRAKIAGGLRSLYGSDTPSRLHDLMDRATFGLSAGYISMSADAIERYVSMGFAREKFFLVRDGIDTARFKPDTAARAAVRDALGIGPEATVILCVANLRPVKNHATQIRVISALAEKGRDAILLLAGEGELRGEILKQAEALGVAARVRLLGPRNDIPELLNAADIFLLTSKWEGIPDSMLEAMSCGAPVVSTEVGCIHEALEDGAGGYLTPPGDEAAMVARLETLAGDPELRRAMGARGRERVCREYSMEKSIAAFEEVCEKITGTRTQ